MSPSVGDVAGGRRWWRRRDSVVLGDALANGHRADRVDGADAGLHLEETALSPAGAPRILGDEVVDAVFGAVADGGDGVVVACGAE